MKHLLAFTLLGLVAVGCAINPATIEVGSSSSKALLVVQVDPIPEKAGVHFQTFRSDNHQLDQRSAEAGSAYILEKNNRSGSYLVAEVVPGNYVMADISQQGHWVLCLHEHTVSFQVKSGQVLFVGKFNAAPHLAQLQSLAKGNPVSLNAETYFYFDNIIPAMILAPSNSDVAALKTHLAEHFSRVSAPIQVAELKADYFLTGRDAFRTQRVCGGFY